MRLGKAADDGTVGRLSQPSGQPLPQYALSHAANAGDHDDGACAVAICSGEKAGQRRATAFLRVAVKVERCIDLDPAAANALFAAAIGWRRFGR